MIASGGALLYFYNYNEYPGKAVIAIFLIACGILLFSFKGKGAEDVSTFSEIVKNWLLWW